MSAAMPAAERRTPWRAILCQVFVTHFDACNPRLSTVRTKAPHRGSTLGRFPHGLYNVQHRNVRLHQQRQGGDFPLRTIRARRPPPSWKTFGNPVYFGAPADQTAPYDDSLLASDGAAYAITSPAAVMQMRKRKYGRSKGWSEG